jgi:hypothetical protein
MYLLASAVEVVLLLVLFNLVTPQQVRNNLFRRHMTFFVLVHRKRKQNKKIKSLNRDKFIKDISRGNA